MQKLIDITGLTITIEPYTYNTSDDYWDANWLSIAVLAKTPHSKIKFDGPYLRTDEILKLKNAISSFITDKLETVTLTTTEPAIEEIRFERDGESMILKLILKPHDFAATHKIQFDLSQEDINGIYQSVTEACELYKVRYL